MGRSRHTSLPEIAWICIAILGGCAHRPEEATTEPGAALDDPISRASRDNAALRRRVQMLEDRVLHLEHSGRGAGAPGAVPATEGPVGRSLPVVRLQADAPPAVSASTWQSTTAAAASEPTAEPPGPGMRHSRTIGPQPTAVAEPIDEIGGFAGAAEPADVDSGRSFRLVGSRLAELSKTERKPDAGSAPADPSRASKTRRGHDSVLSRYQDAMALLKAGHADAAQAAFDGIVRDSPRHEYADNALYWQGEAAYDQRHYADALAAFTRVVEQYGGGNKAPDALLKIGLCYQNLGDQANARDVLTELISAYPAARATAIARVKLAELSAVAAG